MKHKNIAIETPYFAEFINSSSVYIQPQNWPAVYLTDLSYTGASSLKLFVKFYHCMYIGSFVCFGARFSAFDVAVILKYLSYLLIKPIFS